MMQIAATIGVLAAFVGVAYFAGCWYLVHAMVTIDRKPSPESPARLGVPNAEVVPLRTRDGIRLAGWFVPANANQAVILVHGIYSNAWDGQSPDLVRAYHDANINVLLFDSRGQGRSEGHLGLGWLERHDVSVAVAYLRTRGFGPGQIGVHGTSYGAATALLAVAELPEVGAVIADSAFVDIRDVILGEITRRTGLKRQWTNVLAPGIGLIYKVRYGVGFDEVKPERALTAIVPRPVLLIHGELDPVIPVDSVHRLHAAAPASTVVWVLPERQHTEGVRLAPNYELNSPVRENYLKKVTSFLTEHLSTN